MTDRVRLPARSAEEFGERVLVDCPACGGLAIVDRPPAAADEADPPARRMSCTRCAKRIERSAGASDDPTLGIPLRLRLETRHGDLVALNEEHLAYIEAYLAGRLREETPGATGVRNRSVVSRLPRWAKLAKNRAEILAGIERLRRQRLV